MKWMARGIVVVALVASVSGGAWAAGTPPGAGGPDDPVALSLAEALRMAGRESEEVRLARSKVDEVEAQVAAARAAALPRVDANLGYTRTFASPYDGSAGAGSSNPDPFDPDPSRPLEERVRYLEKQVPTAGLGGLGQVFGSLPFGRENAYRASISATQTLYSGGRVGAARSIAGDYLDAARLRFVEEAAEIEFQVRSAYYRALLAVDLEEISGEALEQAERFLVQERRREAAGRASELDVLRAEVARENLRPRLVEARNAAELAELDLKRLIGLPLAQPVRLTTELAPPGPPEGEAPVGAEASLDRRPALQAAERQVDIRESQVRLARGASLPSVDLRVDYGRVNYPSSPFEVGGDWRTDWSATVGVQVPIYAGGKRKAEVEQARAQVEQARLQWAQLREAVQLEYRQAVGERERARAEITARERTVEQAERVHELTRLRYDRGLATQLDVSDARLALLQARTNLAQALADYHTADAKVARAIGRAPAEAQGN